MNQDYSGSFTVLENKTIGRNFAMYRQIKGIKASDIAERLGMKEDAYTKYERGEGDISIDLLRNVAKVLEVNPLMLVAMPPNAILENCSHFALRDYNNYQSSEQQAQAMTKLLENMIALSEKLISLLNREKDR